MKPSAAALLTVVIGVPSAAPHVMPAKAGIEPSSPESLDSCVRACEGIAFSLEGRHSGGFMGESFGGRIVVLGSRSAGGSGLGGGPQTSGGEEIVGKRMPERMSLRLDEPAHGKKAEAVVLAVCMDPLDALAQGVHGLAR